MSKSLNQIILVEDIGKKSKCVNKEVWKWVKGYEGLYKVSSIGRVKSVCKRDRLGRLISEQIIGFNKQGSEYNGIGYVRVNLSKNGKSKYHYVHRLVAEAFIPNVNNKPIIDHINAIKNDNRVINLRWATSKDNANNPITLKTYSENARWKGIKGKYMCTSKRTFQRNLDGTLIKVWDSASEAASSLGIDVRGISNCCNGRQKTAYGFKWNY